MYLHLTQVHSHLRLWSEATDSLTWGSGCPHRTLTCCWRVPFTSQAHTYPSHGRLAASVGTPGGSSVLQSAAEHSLDFLIYLFPHFFLARVLVGGSVHRLCVYVSFGGRAAFPSTARLPQLRSSWTARATQHQLERTPLHPSHGAKQFPVNSHFHLLRGRAGISCTSLPSVILPSLCRSRLRGLDLSLPLRFAPGELLLQAPPWPASALAVPSIPLPAFTSPPPAQPGGRSLIKSL